MKSHLLLYLLIFSVLMSKAQDMNNTLLETIITKASDSITGTRGRWQFSINKTVLICLTDSTNNRMRIISPIIESSRVSDELKTLALSANFHTALDVKYAIADDVLWSVFTHPLKELTYNQVNDAISQVYYGNINFGTTFASTSLVFPGKHYKKTPIKAKTISKQKF